MFTRDYVYCIACVNFSIFCKMSVCLVADRWLVLVMEFWSSIMFRLCYYRYCVSEHYSSSCFYLKHNVSETGFCLHLQVEPTQLVLINRASPCLNLNKNRTMDNVQKHNSCFNIPLSQTFRSYLCYVFSQTSLCHSMILMCFMKTVIILGNIWQIDV
jgi:hypothetical protein